MRVVFRPVHHARHPGDLVAELQTTMIHPSTLGPPLRPAAAQGLPPSRQLPADAPGSSAMARPHITVHRWRARMRSASRS